MNISRSDLYRIVLEEYAKEENIVLTEDRADDLLAWIKGGKKPDDLEYDKTVPNPPPMPGSPDSQSDTHPMDIPSDDAPESEYSGFQNDSGSGIEDQLAALIHGMPPEEVADLFQAVFEKIPGVEMGDAEEEDSETLYSPGAEGRPVAGFQLQELMELIREVLEEGHYHDMGAEDEMYDALDPHGFNKMSDAQIVDQAWKDGLEEMIVLDGEGNLANREEVLTAMKDV